MTSQNTAVYQQHGIYVTVISYNIVGHFLMPRISTCSCITAPLQYAAVGVGGGLLGLLTIKNEIISQ